MLILYILKIINFRNITGGKSAANQNQYIKEFGSALPKPLLGEETEKV